MQSLESIMRHNYESSLDELRRALNLITKRLCLLCKHLEETSQGNILENIDDGKLAEWWIVQKDIEIQRIVQLREKKERQVLRSQEEQRIKAVREKALSKLSLEEMKVLKIN